MSVPSDIVLDSDGSAHFSYTFNNVNAVATGGEMVSSAFVIGRSKWFLTFYPTGKLTQTPQLETFASLLLYHEGSIKERVEFLLVIKNQLDGNDIQYKPLNYEFLNNGYGFLDMIRVSALNQVGNGYLVNNSVIVECTITFPTKRSSFPIELNNYLFNKDFSDAIIRTETESFHVHKLILSMRSPVFKAMLQSTMVEAISNEIIISDFNASVVKEFLVCIYSTECDLHSYDSEMLLELCKIANKYEVRNLKELVEQHIASTLLTVDSFISLMIFAEAYQCILLKKALFVYLAGNMNQLLIAHKTELQELFGELSVEFMVHLNSSK